MIRTYTYEQLVKAVQNNNTISGVLRELNLVAAGGNYRSIKRAIEDNNLDTSHFTYSWNKGKQLKHISEYKGVVKIKRWTIESRGHKCEDCGRSSWKGEPIPIELHHIDGDRTNNSEENLSLLCPNCHTFTENWRRSKTTNDVVILRVPNRPQHKVVVKENKEKLIKVCLDCNKEIYRRATRCKSCAGRLQPTKIDWPSNETLIQMVYSSSYSAVGRQLGVSDNAVRKRLSRQN